MPIRRGVPHAVIDAVDDAGQPVAPLVQDPLQTMTVVGRLDLLRVRRADGAEVVGEDEAGLEAIELAVELQLMVVEQAPAQAGERQVPGRKTPLEPEVLPRLQGAHRATAVAQGQSAIPAETGAGQG